MPSPAPGAADPDGVRQLLAGLGPAQREAVLADDPVVCVLAGAGTGKTRVLTLRVARRVEDGSAHPAHVLVCTFSRKAADELRSRLWTLGVRDGVAAGTFHRTALALVARCRADRGEPPPEVCDRRSLLAAMLEGEGAGSRGDGSRTARGWAAGGRGVGSRGGGSRGVGSRGVGSRNRPAGGPVAVSREVARLDTEIGWAKGRLVSPADYEAAAGHVGRRPGITLGQVAERYDRYEAARRQRGVLDLDDLLWICGDLLASDAAFASATRWWHRHVFVDEAQDMNEAQYQLLCLLAGDEPDLFAVGDPNQSVYGWNGADPALVQRIIEEHAGTRVVRLDANHRCTPQVVAAAAAVLGLRGPTKPTSTRTDGPLPQVVCLPTDEAEAAWIARQVWLAHHPGRQWRSIAVLARTNVQLDRLAVALTAERVPHRVAGVEVGPASDLSGSGGPGARPSPADRDGGTDRTDGGTEDLTEERVGDGGTERRRVDGAGSPDADRGNRAGWPEGDSAEGDGVDDDRVVLSTFHRAKGLQWPVVFVAGLADGIVPFVSARSRAARAEERRLLYVALTRAEDELVCTWAEHADALGPERGDEPRASCPWLEPVRDVVDELRRAQATPDAERAREHLGRIRQLLPSAAGTGPGTTARTGAPGRGLDERG